MSILFAAALLGLIPGILGANTDKPPSIIPTTPSAVFQDSSSSLDGQFVFALGIYQADNATSNATDLYIHMSAPSSYQWMGVGIGPSMAYSLMWIAYPDRNGTSTTLSTRLATGHHEPDYLGKDWGCEQLWDDESATHGNAVTSGDNGTMTLSAVCRNATSWNGSVAYAPSLDTNATSNFIYALGPHNGFGHHGARTLRSDHPDANLNMHSYHGSFTMQLDAAVTNHSSAAGIPKPNGGDGASWMTTNASPAFATADDHSRLPAAHGIIMCLAFVIIFPAGALISRLAHRIVLHAIIQSVGFALVCIGFVIGAVVSVRYHWSHNLTSAHQVIGMLILSALGVQLGLGIVHHRICRKRPQPTLMGSIHKYLGPAIMFAGLINPPIGLALAGNPHFIAAYFGVLVLVVLLLYGTHWVYGRWGDRLQSPRAGAGEGDQTYSVSGPLDGRGKGMDDGVWDEARAYGQRSSYDGDDVPLKPNMAWGSEAVQSPARTRYVPV